MASSDGLRNDQELRNERIVYIYNILIIIFGWIRMTQSQDQTKRRRGIRHPIPSSIALAAFLLFSYLHPHLLSVFVS